MTTKTNGYGLDPTRKIQMWQNGVMMGLITHNEATELLNAGNYHVITSQAIEYPNRGYIND